MALARLNLEFEKMKKDPPSFCSAGPVNRDMFLWQATIIGPPKTPYDGGLFKVEMIFNAQFPSIPPVCRFITKIYHLNVSHCGSICLDLLKDAWSSNISVGNLLLSICNLLTVPNPDDPLDRVKADLYKRDRVAYTVKALEMTKKYAKK